MNNIFSHLYRAILPQIKNKSMCPVCGQEIQVFAPLPDHYIENFKRYGFLYSLDDFETLNHSAYSCTSCGASDRDRLYALYYSKYFDQHKNINISVLDIAPSMTLANYLKTIDGVSLRTADLLMHGVDDCIDITNMNCYGDDDFDSFICSHVLEHVPDDMKALKELYRVLKPGGWGILMVPVLLSLAEIDEDPALEDTAERWRRFAQDDHVRMYSKSGFIERVESVGFLVRQYGQEYFGTDVFREHGISNKSVLYVVYKPK